MKKNLFFLAVAAVAFAACSNDETVAVNESQGEAISFIPVVNNVTRAANIDATALQSSGFWVTAIHSVNSSTYINDQAFTWNSTSSTYGSTPKYYWPTEGTLDFFAYAPTAVSNAQLTKTNYTTFVVTPSTTISEQIDFVYANTDSKSKTGAYTPTGGTASTFGAAGVPLNFRHTGAKIVCKVQNTSSAMKFGVEGWKVGYLYPNGTFAFADTNTDGNNSTTLSFSQWTPGGTKAYSVEYESTFSKIDIAASASATNLAGEMILVPQTLTAATGYANSGSAAVGDKLNNTFIAVKLYALNNEDNNLIAGGGTTASPTTIWAIWPIGGYNWEPGKKYTYTIDLAGCGYYETNQDTNADLDPILKDAEIKFVNVTVDNWTEADGIAISGPSL